MKHLKLTDQFNLIVTGSTCIRKAVLLDEARLMSTAAFKKDKESGANIAQSLDELAEEIDSEWLELLSQLNKAKENAHGAIQDFLGPIQKESKRLKAVLEPKPDFDRQDIAKVRESFSEIIKNNKEGFEKVGDEILIAKAMEVIRSEKKASAVMFQRQFSIGPARASKLMKILEERGVVGPSRGPYPRAILVDSEKPTEVATTGETL